MWRRRGSRGPHPPSPLPPTREEREIGEQFLSPLSRVGRGAGGEGSGIAYNRWRTVSRKKRSMRSTQRLFVAAWLFAALGLAGLAGAQAKKPTAPSPKPASTSKSASTASTPKPAEQEPFIDVVNVGVVNVDVFVTDKKGNPVTNLSKDDFQLFENNRPVEITNFYAVNAGKTLTPLTPVETAATAAAPGAPPPSPADLDKAQTPEEQRLRLI